MKNISIKAVRKEKWEINDELVLKEKKVYVSKDKVLRLEVIWLCHNVLVAMYGDS